jgi:long-chain fatty acid transport protein
MKLCAAAVLLALAPTASATDGYFAPGYGMKAKGRAGTSTAVTGDSFGGANNPATMAYAGNRFDIGIEWFRSDRSASRSGSAGGFGLFDGSADGNEKRDFFIPELGYTYQVDPRMTLGVTVYGNGGMNTNYPTGQLDSGLCQTFQAPNGVKGANLLCGSANLGVDLSQLVIAPTLAYKIADRHAIGVSPLIGYQRFKAYGIEPFASISSDPANVSNNGYDTGWGWGLRVGYYGQITDMIGIGAAYSTKVYMQDLDKYRGLFAEQGGFDIPENFALGVSVRFTPQLLVAADYMRVNYNDVPSVGNPSNPPGCQPNFTGGPATGDACLGASGSSIGFGWQNIDVWRIGAEYAVSPALTLRAGYNYSDNPITERDITFNILAPGVVKHRIAFGFTYTLANRSEISATYWHGFENSISGPANNPYFPVGGTEEIKLSENALGIAWGMKF